MPATLIPVAPFAASTPTATATVTLPTVADDDWLFLIAAAAGTTGGTPSTTNTGTIGGSLTQVGTLQNVSGHSSTAWKRKLVAADSGKTVTVVMSAATARPVIVATVIRGLDATEALDTFAATVTAVGSSINTTPALTTTAANVIELSGVVTTTGANAQADLWTVGTPITKNTEVFTPGTQTTCAAALGTNLATVGNGASVGSRAWTSTAAGVATAGSRSSWTLSAKLATVVTPPPAGSPPVVTLSADPATDAVYGQTVTVSASATDPDGTATTLAISQTSGPTVVFSAPVTAGGITQWTFPVPALYAAAGIGVRVTATDAGGATGNSTVTVGVLPHPDYALVGTTWVPVRRYSEIPA